MLGDIFHLEYSLIPIILICNSFIDMSIEKSFGQKKLFVTHGDECKFAYKTNNFA